jgi:hypothetical protein
MPVNYQLSTDYISIKNVCDSLWGRWGGGVQVFIPIHFNTPSRSCFIKKQTSDQTRSYKIVRIQDFLPDLTQSLIKIVHSTFFVRFCMITNVRLKQNPYKDRVTRNQPDRIWSDQFCHQVNIYDLISNSELSGRGYFRNVWSAKTMELGFSVLFRVDTTVSFYKVDKKLQLLFALNMLCVLKKTIFQLLWNSHILRSKIESVSFKSEVFRFPLVLITHRLLLHTGSY